MRVKPALIGSPAQYAVSKPSIEGLHLGRGWFGSEREDHNPNQVSKPQQNIVNIQRCLLFISIHLDLLASNVIPDPYIGRNESTVQWIHSRDWLYNCEFSAEPTQECEQMYLSFEGLDTFATVTLNGNEIFKYATHPLNQAH